jgi:hypothetical protein
MGKGASALFIKSHLEFLRHNHRKAARLLHGVPKSQVCIELRLCYYVFLCVTNLLLDNSLQMIDITSMCTSFVKEYFLMDLFMCMLFR